MCAYCNYVAPAAKELITMRMYMCMWLQTFISHSLHYKPVIPCLVVVYLILGLV